MRTVDIKKNDEVEVIAGKDRGKRGRVVNVLPRENRVMVEGVARAKRHLPVRPTARGGQTGGIILKEQFIDLSNVMVVCKSCGKATRIGHREDSGIKLRVCRRCEAEI
jgi:large subunit ribosomal protein L24